MSIRMLYLKHKPQDDPNYRKVIITPLKKGLGNVIGNSLRRILLSSLPGAGIASVKVENILHEFSLVEGMYENISDFVNNLKKIVFKLDGNEPVTVILDIKGPAEVRAKDLRAPAGLEILNPEIYICTLNHKAKIYAEIIIKNGRGYISDIKNRNDSAPIGTIYTDTDFSPVNKVRYFVEPFATHENLTMEIWTNGSIRVDHALTLSAKFLKKHFEPFFEEIAPVNTQTAEEEKKVEKVIDKGSISISDLELSVRSRNCIKMLNAQTLGELCNYSCQEVMELKNFGKKSLDEIRQKLCQYGMSLKGDDLLKEEK